MTTSGRTADLSIWLWLVIPVLVLLFLFIAEFFFSHDLITALINEEHGIIENGTFVILLIGIYFGCKCVRRAKSSSLSKWFLLITLICFYFAGEEISWGQHYFGWETPGIIQDVNDQNETNLHNMSSWLDQKPRLILEIVVLIGGVFVPIYLKLCKVSYSTEDWKFIVIPTFLILPTAIFTIASRIPERFNDYFSDYRIDLSLRFSEIQEFFFAYFLMLYLINCHKRLNLTI